MQINLKQSDITKALAQYVVAQGINLAGKEVSMEFTAGRKEAGISVEITIAESMVPPFAPEAETPTLSVVKSIAPVVPVASIALQAAAVTPVADAAQASTPSSTPGAPAAASLFGG